VSILESRSATRHLQASHLLVAVVLLALAATGCGREDDAASIAPAPAAGAEPETEADPPSEVEDDATFDLPITTTVMPASVPVRLLIPAIGVDSTLMDLGLQADQSLEVPPQGFPAGWYTDAPTPGELGPAIIAGHVDWGGQPGVFFDLRDLTSGDEVTITRRDGSTARFQVTHVQRVAKDAFPTEAVYGDIDHAGLRLITCGGAFDRNARSYTDNLIAFAELIDS